MTSEITHIRPAQLEAWSQSQATAVVVLDVREPWELQLASIKTAACAVIALPMTLLPSRMSELKPEAPIAVLCHHGVRSMQVANFLVRNGFSNVANISGGIAAWSAEVDASVPQY